MPTEAEIAWLAGIIDGEGSVVFVPRESQAGYHLCRISLANTSEEILDDVQRILYELGCVSYRTAKPIGRLGKKPCWDVHAGRQEEVPVVLRAILPYLRHEGKRDKAAQAIAYMESYKYRSDGRRLNTVKGGGSNS